jgi:hypothetical protein
LSQAAGGALTKNALVSIGGEIAYGAAKGALVGGISTSIATGDIDNFGEGAKYGAVGGAVGSAMTIAYSGYLYNTGYEKGLAEQFPDNAKSLYTPGFRNGAYSLKAGMNSLANAIRKTPDQNWQGVRSMLTGDITIRDNNPRTVGHEFSHYTDAMNEGPINQFFNYGRNQSYYESNARANGQQVYEYYNDF